MEAIHEFSLRIQLGPSSSPTAIDSPIGYLNVTRLHGRRRYYCIC